MDPVTILNEAHTLYARASTSTSNNTRPPIYKVVGIILAVSSGLFIGTSYVLKKVGLLKANVKYNEEAGEGYGYLKNAWWWAGMTLMIIGEICNTVAYAFVDAILVTPLGALSVVITTILSAIFLKERLSFVGKVGCFNCIIGSVVIAMNAPEQSSVANIQDMQKFVIAPGFLSYAGVVIVGCAFVAFWVGPRYGKKSMFVYISICSLIGGLSVVATQGLGAAIVAQASGTTKENQFKQWFLYVLLVFVISTLLTEIIYLNKALNLFNAALVTPTYYVLFTSATIVTSAVLFQGFKGSAVTITTVVLGFLQICAGVVLLQLSKSAKDIPDAAIFKGDLDQVRQVGEQEQPESEPKADAIRGAAAIVRRLSTPRQKMEAEEARRLFNEKRLDDLEPVGENEVVEWDGLRRRKTIIGQGPTATPQRTKTLHPPLGMSRFPEENEQQELDRRPSTRESGHSFWGDVRNRATSVLHSPWRPSSQPGQDGHSPLHPYALTDINMQHQNTDENTAYQGAGGLAEPFEPLRSGRDRSDTRPSVAWAENAGSHSPSSNSLAPEPPKHGAHRQFSFQNVFHRHQPNDSPGKSVRSPLRSGLRSRAESHGQRQAMKNATEEERLGLVQGDAEGVGPERSQSISSSDSDSMDRNPGDFEAERNRQVSRSTTSTATAPFPPYHEYFPPSHGASLPRGVDDSESEWPAPYARSAGASLSAEQPPRVPVPRYHNRPSTPTSNLANPLPPVPRDGSTSPVAGEPYTRIELRETSSPEQASPEQGVMSLSSSSGTGNGSRDGSGGRPRIRGGEWQRVRQSGRGSSGSGSGSGSDRNASRHRPQPAFI